MWGALLVFFPLASTEMVGCSLDEGEASNYGQCEQLSSIERAIFSGLDCEHKSSLSISRSQGNLKGAFEVTAILLHLITIPTPQESQ